MKVLRYLGVSFEWVKSVRRKKSIALVTTSNSEVPWQVKTPADWSEKDLKQFLQQHQSWFLKAVKRKRPPYEVKRLQRGERLTLLDNSYRLEVVFGGLSAAQVSSIQQGWGIWCVALSSQKVHYALNNLGLEGLGLLVQREIQNELQDYFCAWLQPQLIYWQQKMGVRVSAVKVRSYRGRWGSCDTKGRVQFNWRLVFAPEWVAQYVVIHELAHLIEHNHSAKFWQIVADYCPKYREAKAVLKEQGPAWIEAQ